ncbi:hypothetical protein BRARA_F03872 [Brassica rapa]|uniref:Uncharacterized protein n=1 Tax=Brassica campestris TaxID=3711 RepID=A0A397Z507_BRACM|nr:hypothetical protein BRARA_F03872 [Brassica rapa]
MKAFNIFVLSFPAISSSSAETLLDPAVSSRYCLYTLQKALDIDTDRIQSLCFPCEIPL